MKVTGKSITSSSQVRQVQSKLKILSRVRWWEELKLRWFPMARKWWSMLMTWICLKKIPMAHSLHLNLSGSGWITEDGSIASRTRSLKKLKIFSSLLQWVPLEEAVTRFLVVSKPNSWWLTLLSHLSPKCEGSSKTFYHTNSLLKISMIKSNRFQRHLPMPLSICTIP